MTDSQLDDFIAGKLRSKDWENRKAQIILGECAGLWAETFQEFLMQRLSLRYLKPIEILQETSTFQGEGFTIVSIQCTLIEFLAALKAGKNYKFAPQGAFLAEHEYSNSSQLFCNFLITEEPFRQWFPNMAAAKDFYGNVRCALLHEARTKGGWRIWASGTKGIDAEKKIVWRNEMQSAILSYIYSYGILLTREKVIQEAFIRKFDHLSAH